MKQGKVNVQKGLTQEVLIDRWIELINSRNFEAVRRCLASDVELFGNCVLDIIPDSLGTIKSDQTIIRFFEILFRRFPKRIYRKHALHKLENKTLVHLLDEHNEDHFLGIRINAQQLIVRLEMCEHRSS